MNSFIFDSPGLCPGYAPAMPPVLQAAGFIPVVRDLQPTHDRPTAPQAAGFTPVEVDIQPNHDRPTTPQAPGFTPHLYPHF